MKLSNLKRIIGVIVIIIIFFFLGKSLYKNWLNIGDAVHKLNFVYVGLFYLFVFLSFIVVSYAWKRSLTMLRENISFIAALRINGLATLPKYVPGKVWGIIGKGYLAKKEGISEHNCIISISLETILYLLGGIILFLLSGAHVLKGKIQILFYVVLIPICFLFIYPKVLITVTNFFLKIFKRPPIDVMPSFSNILELLLLYTSNWIVQGIAIYFLIKSFYPIHLNQLFVVSGFHAFSWVVGFVSIITPAGLGVKEGIFSYFLGYIMPPGIAVLITLVVRVLSTIGELVYFLIFSTAVKKYL